MCNFAKIFLVALTCVTLVTARYRYFNSHKTPKQAQSPPPHPFKEERERAKAESEGEFETRIAGGGEALTGDVPWHIQVRYLDDYLCGAALVLSPHGNQVVLTAGQCITQKKPSKKFLPAKDLSVIAGRVDINGFHIFEQYRAITHIERHPDWRRKTVGLIHDIACLHIEYEFELNRLVEPIRLPSYTDVNPWGKLIVSGWGYYFHTQKEYADSLQVGAIEIIYNEDCNSRYVYDDNVPKVSFCAGKPRSPTYQGACMGDEGSPGIALFNSTYLLVGLFSWGAPKCGNRYKPSVFTSVSWYLRWLLKAAYPRPGRKKRDVSDNSLENVTLTSR